MIALNELRTETLALGFSLFGVAPAAEADHFDFYCDWLDRGYAGEMRYLHDRRDARRHPDSILPGVRSVVMLGLEYGMDTLASSNQTNHRGKVSKYARGADYHRVIWDRLKRISEWICQQVPGAVCRGVTDSAPLLERDFARRAGLGWVGKNTMLINKHRGSFFFLAGLLTSLELPSSEPHPASHCGTCTACLDACPTNAFPSPGTLDATKCISYLTIELRTAIPLELRDGMGDWLFGCDICQDVCPWNRQKPATSRVPYPEQNSEMTTLDAIELLTITDTDFRQRFRGTPLFRTRRSGLRRNAAIVLGNIGDERALPALRDAAADADEVVRETALWAIERIARRKS